MWSTVVGLFKFSREESALTHIYFIIFVCSLIYKARIWNNWQGIRLVTFRTWVRSQVPTLSIYFFPINIRMQV